MPNEDFRECYKPVNGCHSQYAEEKNLSIGSRILFIKVLLPWFSVQPAWKRLALFIPFIIFAAAISPPFLSACTEFVMIATLLTTAPSISTPTHLFTKAVGRFCGRAILTRPRGSGLGFCHRLCHVLPHPKSMQSLSTLWEKRFCVHSNLCHLNRFPG